MRKSKKNKGKFLITIGVLLIVVGTNLLLYFKYKVESQKRQGIILEEKMVEEIDKDKKEKNDKGEQKSKEAKPSNKTEYKEKNYTENDEEAIGVIRIDKINVVLPIYDDSSNQSLSDGVGLVDTTDLPSSNKNTITVLAGHRGSRSGLEYFLNIGKLQNDDKIRITTNDEILYYKVTGEEIIQPDDWSRFIREEDKTKLYLMSCHPYPLNTHRLIIKAELVSASDK